MQYREARRQLMEIPAGETRTVNGKQFFRRSYSIWESGKYDCLGPHDATELCIEQPAETVERKADD